MRWCVLLLTLLGVAAPAAAFPMPSAPRAYVKQPRHPDEALKEALIFFELKVDPREWCYYRFVHYLATPDADLAEEVGNLRATLPMVSTGPVVARPVPIDKDGRVFAIDMRETGWNPPAFAAVAHLDRTCTEPNIDGRLAREVRQAIGVAQDPRTRHCEALVPGPWFVRELSEADRHRNDPENIAYYNLLYAKERFHDPGRPPPPPKYQPWKGGTWPGDGKRYDKGAFDWVPFEAKAEYDRELAAWAAKRGAFKADFPRDADDWLKRWGAKAAEDFLAEERLFKKNGTIVAGIRNDPKNGSIVSYNDRVLEFLNGPLGLVMRTRDFFKTAGKSNPANNPLGTALGLLEEDAGEHIAQKPDDYPAWLLTGGAKAGRKRAEFGDPHAVRSSLDPHNILVLTFNSCVICHYPSDVVLAPGNNKVGAALARRNELLAFTKEEQQVIGQFFFDGDAARGGWGYKLRNWREPFARALARATATPAEPAGWTGEAWAKASVRRRQWYDAPVTLDQAAAEVGVPKLALMGALLLVGSIDAGNLFLDEEGVPRAAWDEDLFPLVATIVAVARDAEGVDPTFAFLFPDLVREPFVASIPTKAREPRGEDHALPVGGPGRVRPARPRRAAGGRGRRLRLHRAEVLPVAVF